MYRLTKGPSYLYGGLGEKDGSAGFDDVYALTIPSFTWVRLYPTDSNSTGAYPHHSMSCNVVNEAQMIIQGGYFPLTTDCDSPDQWGVHNLDMGKDNNDSSVWALYDPSKTTYEVPTDIISIIGGKSTGGATKTAPANGWDHTDLSVLMTRKADVDVRTATRAVSAETSSADASSDDNSSSLSTGAIVGIAIGGAAGLAFVLVGIWCLVRRRRGSRVSTNVSQQQPMNQTYDYHPPQSNSNMSPGPWSPQSSTFATSSPPPFNNSPQTISSHINQGPPAELPTESNNAPTSPFPETPIVPKYDQHGNLWVPQVAMMETRSPDGSNSNTYQSQGSTAKDSTIHEQQDPQELATEVQRNDLGSRENVHQTYYHP